MNMFFSRLILRFRSFQLQENNKEKRMNYGNNKFYVFSNYFNLSRLQGYDNDYVTMPFK